MTYGMWNFEKISDENLTDCSLHLSDVATVPWEIQKKVIFNSFIHTYFWLFTLSHNKTICNLLAHPTWKCHHINLWISKLFHLTKGSLRSFKRWRLWKEPVVVGIGGSEKNPLRYVETGMSGNQCHSKCSEWPPSALIHASGLFRHCSVA